MAITINGSGTVTGLAVGGLPDNVVDKDTLAVGVQSKVLQVVQGTTTTSVSNSTTTYVTTGLTATITPTLATSKILVIVSQNGIAKGAASSGVNYNLKLYKNAVAHVNISVLGGYYLTSQIIGLSNSLNYLDSPATTSAITYATYFNSTATYATTMQAQGVNSTITLMEIGV